MQFTKYIFIFSLIVLIQGNCFSQIISSGSVFKKYLTSKGMENINYPYVNSYTTSGNKFIEHQLYYKKDTHYILAVLKAGNSTFTEQHFQDDVLFDLVSENLKYLKRNQYADKDADKFRENRSDSIPIVTQIGIRYKGLHYNHFMESSNEFIERVKNEKMKIGYHTINLLAAFFKNSHKTGM